MFVFLSARLFGQPTEATYRAASLVEILHQPRLFMTMWWTILWKDGVFFLFMHFGKIKHRFWWETTCWPKG